MIHDYHRSCISTTIVAFLQSLLLYAVCLFFICLGFFLYLGGTRWIQGFAEHALWKSLHIFGSFDQAFPNRHVHCLKRLLKGPLCKNMCILIGHSRLCSGWQYTSNDKAGDVHLWNWAWPSMNTLNLHAIPLNTHTHTISLSVEESKGFNSNCMLTISQYISASSLLDPMS